MAARASPGNCHEGKQREEGYVTTVAVTALCGVTEPAFYGCLIERPRLLVGTAIGALCAGLPAGIFVLKSMLREHAPAFFRHSSLSLPMSMGNFVLACVVAIIAIVVSFIAARVIIKKNPSYIE